MNFALMYFQNESLWDNPVLHFPGSKIAMYIERVGYPKFMGLEPRSSVECFAAS